MVMTRYEQLAQQIREQIQNRVWRAGDKLPSLRESGKRAGLSLMTVVQSYQLLESQGWIVARPQSGYYVAARPQPLPQPSRGEKLLLSEQVDINAFIFDVLQACKDPDIVPFGSAFPDATLFAQPKLARALSSVARKFTPHSSLANLPPGNDALRRHIAQRYALSGMQVAPDEIVITAGGDGVAQPQPAGGDPAGRLCGDRIAGVLRRAAGAGTAAVKGGGDRHPSAGRYRSGCAAAGGGTVSDQSLLADDPLPEPAGRHPAGGQQAASGGAVARPTDFAD